MDGNKQNFFHLLFLKVVPNTFTKINLACLIFIKFWQSNYLDPLTKIYKNFKKFEPTILSKKITLVIYISLTNTNFDHW